VTHGYRFDFATGHVTLLEECPGCGEMAELSDAPNGGRTYAAPLCHACRNPPREPESQMERDGDA
jgi:hypothetical protein